MALPRSLHRRVELRGQPLEEIDPVVVALLSLRFAQPDDHEVLLGGHVDVLPILAPRREVMGLAVWRVDPPEVLVILGRIRAGVRARGLFYPTSGDELPTLPVSLPGEQHAEPREVPRSRVDPALHLLEAAPRAIQAPGAILLHTHGLPQLLLQVAGDGHSGSPLEYQTHQQGVVVVVLKVLSRLALDPAVQCQ